MDDVRRAFALYDRFELHLSCTGTNEFCRLRKMHQPLYEGVAGLSVCKGV